MEILTKVGQCVSAVTAVTTTVVTEVLPAVVFGPAGDADPAAAPKWYEPLLKHTNIVSMMLADARAQGFTRRANANLEGYMELDDLATEECQLMIGYALQRCDASYRNMLLRRTFDEYMKANPNKEPAILVNRINGSVDDVTGQEWDSAVRAARDVGGMNYEHQDLQRYATALADIMRGPTLDTAMFCSCTPGFRRAGYKLLGEADNVNLTTAYLGAADGPKVFRELLDKPMQATHLVMLLHCATYADKPKCGLVSVDSVQSRFPRKQMDISVVAAQPPQPPRGWWTATKAAATGWFSRAAGKPWAVGAYVGEFENPGTVTQRVFLDDENFNNSFMLMDDKDQQLVLDTLVGIYIQEDDDPGNSTKEPNAIKVLRTATKSGAVGNKWTGVRDLSAFKADLQFRLKLKRENFTLTLPIYRYIKAFGQPGFLDRQVAQSANRPVGSELRLVQLDADEQRLLYGASDARFNQWAAESYKVDELRDSRALWRDAKTQVYLQDEDLLRKDEDEKVQAAWRACFEVLGTGQYSAVGDDEVTVGTSATDYKLYEFLWFHWKTIESLFPSDGWNVFKEWVKSLNEPNRDTRFDTYQPVDLTADDPDTLLPDAIGMGFKIRLAVPVLHWPPEQVFELGEAMIKNTRDNYSVWLLRSSKVRLMANLSQGLADYRESLSRLEADGEHTVADVRRVQRALNDKSLIERLGTAVVPASAGSDGHVKPFDDATKEALRSMHRATDYAGTVYEGHEAGYEMSAQDIINNVHHGSVYMGTLQTKPVPAMELWAAGVISDKLTLLLQTQLVPETVKAAWATFTNFTKGTDHQRFGTFEGNPGWEENRLASGVRLIDQLEEWAHEQTKGVNTRTDTSTAGNPGFTVPAGWMAVNATVTNNTNYTGSINREGRYINVALFVYLAYYEPGRSAATVMPRYHKLVGDTEPREYKVFHNKPFTADDIDVLRDFIKESIKRLRADGRVAMADYMKEKNLIRPKALNEWMDGLEYLDIAKNRKGFHPVDLVEYINPYSGEFTYFREIPRPNTDLVDPGVRATVNRALLEHLVPRPAGATADMISKRIANILANGGYAIWARLLERGFFAPDALTATNIGVVRAHGRSQRTIGGSAASDTVHQYTKAVFTSLAKVKQAMPFLQASLIFYDVTEDEDGERNVQLKSAFTRGINQLTGTSTAASPIVMGEIIASQVKGTSTGAKKSREYMDMKVGAAEAELDGLFSSINLHMTMLLARNSLRTSVQQTWWARAHQITSTDSGPTNLYRGYAKRTLADDSLVRAISPTRRLKKEKSKILTGKRLFNGSFASGPFGNGRKRSTRPARSQLPLWRAQRARKARRAEIARRAEERQRAKADTKTERSGEEDLGEELTDFPFESQSSWA